MPLDAAALSGHDLIVVEPLNRWRLADPRNEAVTELQPAARMRVDDMRLAVASAVDGGGILLCPEVQCHGELASTGLVEVLPGWVRERRQIYAVWAQQRYLPARVRALLEHLAQAVAAEPLLQDRECP
jgi:LysR family transcriptional regulator AphB